MEIDIHGKVSGSIDFPCGCSFVEWCAQTPAEIPHLSGRRSQRAE